MASFVISGCGLKPLPRIYPKPRSVQNSFSTSNLRISGPNQFSSSSIGINQKRNWGLGVSAPLRIQPLEEENEEFDPAAPPPFKLSDIKAAIPKHCWVKDPWRSVGYVVRDVVAVLGMAAAAAYFNSWIVWPLYWFAQSTMFWALFVLGHDW